MYLFHKYYCILYRVPDTDLNSTYIVMNETQALLSRGPDNKQVNKRPSVSDKHSGEKKAAAGT